ncbi:MAG TPA: ABC transporter ATP-binding protein [Candidatus Cloacimonadota bacterium]|nr:ABC transporter ATP-binding protein [Candidatus Cloacimonadota bacterium]
MITLHEVCCGYADQDVLHEVELELPPQGFTALMGPNGAGKSTLLYAILGYLKLRRGRVEIFGKNLATYRREALARHIAFIPQEIHNEFDYTVFDTVLMGRYPYLSLMQSYGSTDHAIVDSVLNQLALWDLKDRYLMELSGGEKQRVYIARALAQDTRYILLDESLSQLDINYQLEIMHLLRKITTEQGKAIILISHNLNLAANYADRLIYLKSGRVIHSGSPRELVQTDKLTELFGIALSTAINPISGNPNIIYP